MSKNVVDAVLEYNSEKKDFQIGFIPSRRQVDYCNGYVNNWTTETFAQYVKLNNNSTIVQRDHGGPGQGFFKDDGKESFESDARWFDIIHIDPWKEYPNYEKGLEKTIDGIRFCNSISPDCRFEIGTEETIRPFSVGDLERLISDVRLSLGEELFSKVVYAVVQSGVGLDLKRQSNVGSFDIERLRSMVSVCQGARLLSKEHNGDYLSVSQLKIRFDSGLTAINIAPQFGQFETEVYLDLMSELHPSFFNRFFEICNKSRRWKKWVGDSFNPNLCKQQVVIICGHYVLSEKEFLNLRSDMVDELSFDLTEIDRMIKDRIIKHIQKLQSALI